jgi:hypothetical protein
LIVALVDALAEVTHEFEPEDYPPDWELPQTCTASRRYDWGVGICAELDADPVHRTPARVRRELLGSRHDPAATAPGLLCELCGVATSQPGVPRRLPG